MRNLVLRWAAAAVIAAAGASPALACGYVGGCGFGYSGYGPYDYVRAAPHERLPLPTGVYSPGPHPRIGQYYHVNQGPTFSGPGNFAPYPTYQETAVRGWTGYERGFDYPYDGGPYGNAFNHFSDFAPVWHGPTVTTYRWHGGRTHRPRVQRFGAFHGRAGHPARTAN